MTICRHGESSLPSASEFPLPLFALCSLILREWAPRQASSLSEACNAPKHHYDTCFNHWLKSYLLLVAPPLSNASDTSAGVKEREKRTKALSDKKEELETKCGRQYREYQKCLSVSHSVGNLSARRSLLLLTNVSFDPLQTAIKGVDGLSELLAGARREEPLDGWGGIKLTT